MAKNNETVTLFVTNRKKGASFRNVRNYFTDNNIQFEIRMLDHEPITKEELNAILSNCENGFDDVICSNGSDIKELKEMGVDVDELSLTELHYVLQRHPGLLRLPISMIEDVTMAGYNSELIPVFKPRRIRRKQFGELLEQIRENEDHTKMGAKGNSSSYSTDRNKLLA